MSNDSQTPEGSDPNHDSEHGPDVTIRVNGTPFQIHRGRETVAAIKATAGVPAAYVLEQNIDGTLRELPPEGAVTIKGDEVFLAYPPASQSSH